MTDPDFKGARAVEKQLSDLALKRLRAQWCDREVPLIAIIRSFRLGEATVRKLCADLPPRARPVRLSTRYARKSA